MNDTDSTDDSEQVWDKELVERVNHKIDQFWREYRQIRKQSRHELEVQRQMEEGFLWDLTKGLLLFLVFPFSMIELVIYFL